jgi:hypothetical protein
MLLTQSGWDRRHRLTRCAQQIDAVSAPDLDLPVNPQGGQRLPQRGAADAEESGQLALRRQPVAGLESLTHG